ncbi:MAG: hypothetical protein ABIP64_07895 [Burkholderiales bacterium]
MKGEAGDSRTLKSSSAAAAPETGGSAKGDFGPPQGEPVKPTLTSPPQVPPACGHAVVLAGGLHHRECWISMCARCGAERPMSHRVAAAALLLAVAAVMAAEPDVAQQPALDDTRWTLPRAEPDDVRQLAAVLGIQYRQLANREFNHATILTLLDSDGHVAARATQLSKPDPAFIAALRRALILN